MELRILTPMEKMRLPEVEWNNTELKEEIIARVSDYNSMAYTDKDVKDMKVDRATLNKLVSAFEDERKSYKKFYMAPYEKFEKEIKDVLEPAVNAEKLLASKIKEVDEQRRIQKRKDIEAVFKTIGFQNFVKLDSIFDEKWLNASVSLPQIEDAMKTIMYRIGDEVFTIRGLPEFSFEVLEMYKKSLNIAKSIQEGQRLSDIQKRKADYEAEKQKKAAEEAKRQEEAAMKISQEEVVSSDPDTKQAIPAAPQQQEKLYTVDFRVNTTKEKLELLKNFFRLNNITYGPVPKKGE